MENIFIEFLPPWVETGVQPAFYDKESGTVLQQTARMYAKVNELIKNNNKLNEDFKTLYNYVYDYFKNLDVQEEINNKLDEMTEDGTLQAIITAYLQANGVLVYNTLADLEDAVNIINGSVCYTIGTLTYNDGQPRVYKIRSITSGDVVDGDNIIALTIDNTLIGEKIKDNTIITLVNQNTYLTPEQFGAVGDGLTDDTLAFQACIDEAITTGLPVLASKTYLITDSLTVDGTITIDGCKGYDQLVETDKVNIIYSGDDYLFDTTTEYDGCLFKNLRIKGDSTNKGFKNTGYRNIYDNLSIIDMSIAIDFPGTITIWRGENKVKDCLFGDCTKCINIDHRLYADSTIEGCTFVHGDYALYGCFNAWLFTNNHDYTLHGVELSECANSQFTNNYFDKSQYMPFIKITTAIAGSNVIADNKFLSGTNISSPSSIIQYENTLNGCMLVLTNNIASGTKYSGSYFIDFIGTNNTTVSMANNQVFPIAGKLVNHVSKISAGGSTGFGQPMSATSISGTANFNNIFFNNGVASIQLEVSNAGAVIGVLPFNPAVSIRVPAWNASKSAMGSVLLNTNGNITNNNNWLGDTVLINATYMVYYQGNLGDN